MTRASRKPPAEPEKTMLAIKLPDAERGVGPSALARFEKAQRALANPMTKPRARDEHARTVARIEAAPKEAAEKVWLDESLADSARRAIDQGETVERAKSGRVNVVSRDAVKSLGQAKALSADEIATASLFKDLYEARFADSGAASYGDAKGGGHNHEAFIAKRFERALACEVVGRAERAIAVQCSSDPTSLQVFRGVLDENKALSSFGKGRAFERNLASLTRALAVAREAWLTWKRERAARHVVNAEMANTTA